VNIAKHMEAVFIVALATAGAASFLDDPLPQAQARAGAIIDSSIATETKMAVVLVKGKRPGAAGPATVLAEQRGAARKL
jgi:hypothetical protein